MGIVGLDHQKFQVAEGFFRNTGMDHPREANKHIGSNCFSREVSAALCEAC